MQPDPLSADFFARLGLPATFDLDLKTLEQSYFKLQRDFHPDRLASKSPQERAVAMQASMNINEAYNILKLPIRRAQHLLSRQGMHILGEKDSLKPDPALLMEMMDLRERLENGDTTILAQAATAQNESLKQVSLALEAKDWHKAAQATMRAHYLQKLQDEARLTNQRATL